MNITLRSTTLVACVLAGALALAVAFVVLLPKAASAAPPGPIPFPRDTVRGACDFPVLVETIGKSKVIELPGGDTLFKNPHLRVTLTNIDEPTNRVTYVDSGTVRVTELESGEALLVATGRNVLYGKNIGVFLAIGRFSTVIDNEGISTPPTGRGRLIDVCERLA